MSARLEAIWRRFRGLSRATRGLLASLVLLVVLLAVLLTAVSPSPSGRSIPLSQFYTLIADGQVAVATLRDQDHQVQGRLTDGSTFHTTYPSSDVETSRLVDKLNQRGVPVTVDAQTDKAQLKVLTQAIIPVLILANLFALLFVGRGQSGLGDVEAFGRLDRMGQVGGRVTFADVAGVEEAREELMEVVDYLRRPERYAALGASPPKGVLLFGPPGCGKTLVARAVAGEAGVPFFSVAGAEFVESLVGVGAARVRDLFATVRSVAPAIVFIDELDAAGRRRGSGTGGGAEERDQTLNQLLVEMDGFQIAEGIVVIAATNRPDIIDPALLRPGRFDRHVVFDRPDIERREQILRLHAQARPVADDVDFTELARQTPGFTGADLANTLNEGALLAIRQDKAVVDRSTLSEAVQRVLGGPQRRGHLLTDDERHRVACHEAGHAVVAALLGDRDHVHRVSIVARGRGVGTTALDREDSEIIRTVTQLRGRLALALAGRAAEEHVLGSASTGAADDLDYATRIAREMAGVHGFTDEVGMVSLIAPDNDHLGARPVPEGLSERQHAALDEAVVRLIAEAGRAARTLVARADRELQSLTQRLLDDETLEGPALLALLPRPLEPAELEAQLA